MILLIIKRLKYLHLDMLQLFMLELILLQSLGLLQQVYAGAQTVIETQP